MAKKNSNLLLFGGLGAAALVAAVALGSKKEEEGPNGSNLPSPGPQGDVKSHLGVRYRVDPVSNGFVYYIENQNGVFAYVDDGPFETQTDAGVAARQTIETILTPEPEPPTDPDLPGVDSEPGSGGLTFSNTTAD